MAQTSSSTYDDLRHQLDKHSRLAEATLNALSAISLRLVLVFLGWSLKVLYLGAAKRLAAMGCCCSKCQTLQVHVLRFKLLQCVNRPPTTIICCAARLWSSASCMITL